MRKTWGNATAANSNAETALKDCQVDTGKLIQGQKQCGTGESGNPLPACSFLNE